VNLSRLRRLESDFYVRRLQALECVLGGGSFREAGRDLGISGSQAGNLVYSLMRIFRHPQSRFRGTFLHRCAEASSFPRPGDQWAAARLAYDRASSAERDGAVVEALSGLQAEKEMLLEEYRRQLAAEVSAKRSSALTRAARGAGHWAKILGDLGESDLAHSLGLLQRAILARIGVLTPTPAKPACTSPPAPRS